MKHLNHLGSAVLLALTVFLAVILLLPALGVAINWTPKTTPHRLLANPFIAWCLVAALAGGLALIRAGTLFQQCVSALVLVGLIFGLALATGLFWDAWLSPMLVLAALPVQRAATDTLKSLVR